MNQDRAPSSSSGPAQGRPVAWEGTARRRGERFLLGALVGLAMALVLSGAANIALYRDAQCRQSNRDVRWGQPFATCLSDVAQWEVSAVAHGPSAADSGDGSLMSWLAIPLAYTLLGGLIGQLPLRTAVLGALILQVLIVGMLALMGFFAVFVG